MRSSFFIAAASDNPRGGIYQYETDDGTPPRQIAFYPLANANYFAFSPDRTMLFATCTVGAEGGVAAFRLLPDGTLEACGAVPSGGTATCHVAAAPGGNFLYTANYSSGSFTEYRLRGNGIVERTRILRHSGRGVNPVRQESAHPHFTNFTPDGGFLCVIDLGIDTVRLYPFDPERGIDPERAADCRIAPPGAGPRHLIFDRSGQRAYLLNELGNSVTTLDYDGGRLIQRGTFPTLPRFARDAVSKAAAIRLSPDERWLFASNRGYDSIAVFRLDGGGGMEFHDLVLTGGSSPRDINFLPGGTIFAAANEFSDTVMFYDFDTERGKLTPNGAVFSHMPRPLCIAF